MRGVKVGELSALVDGDDYDRVCCKFWNLNKGYAQTNIPKSNGVGSTTTTMHRFILKAKRGILIDHINGDKLDNRRANLRIASFSLNAQNHRLYKTSKTGISGVFKGERGKFIVYINVEGKRHHIGSFTELAQAATARQEAEIAHYGFHLLHNLQEV